MWRAIILSAMETNSTNHRETLAILIRDRRKQLGLKQADLKEHGGPSPETVIKFEQGKIPESPHPRTLHGFDTALKWESGSCATVLNGGAPKNLPELPGTGRHEEHLICLPRNVIQDVSMAVAKLALLVTTGAVDVPVELLAQIQAPVQIMTGVMEAADRGDDGAITSLLSKLW